MNEEIRHRFKQLINILKSAKEVRLTETTCKLAVQYEKEYYKRMKNKLMWNRKHPRAIKNHEEPNKYALESLSRDIADRHMSDTAVTFPLIQLM